MKATHLFRIVFVAVALAFGVAAVQAQDLGALKARMEQRQGFVDALKDSKKVGENNRALLEPRAAISPDETRVMSDENADRSAVYAAIAAQTGVSPDQVARARAHKIAESSKPGVWIQAPDGSWFEKR